MPAKRCPAMQIGKGCTVRPYLVDNPGEFDADIGVAFEVRCRGMEMVGAMDDFEEHGLVALFERRRPARRRG